MIPAFFDKIPNYKSISLIGTAKNVGKTYCLRALLQYYKDRGEYIAVTSIGVDGESTDSLYATSKPELTFYTGMLTQTSEQHYRSRHLTAQILQLSRSRTALGRLVTSKVEVPGKMILSGASHTYGLKTFINDAHKFGAKTVLIDGALSRASLASPAVAEGVILCTGTALSKSLSQIIQDASFRCKLMELPIYENVLQPQLAQDLEGVQSGVWAVYEDKKPEYTGLRSTLLNNACKELLSSSATPDTFYVSGAVSESFLSYLTEKNIAKKGYKIIISDFTKMFVQAHTYKKFLNTGGQIYVLRSTKLIAICANPYSPEGYSINADILKGELSKSLNREVFVLDS